MTTHQTEFPPASAESEKPPAVKSPAETSNEKGSCDAEAAGALLPILIEVRGEVVSSNFAIFAAAVRARLAEINLNLVTDEDFEQASKDATAIAGAEASLKAAKEKALSDAEQLHALFSQIDGVSEELADARLNLAKQIKARKEERRKEIINEALSEFDSIDAPLAKTAFRKSVEESTKGKRTVESMEKATNAVMVIHLATIRKNRERIESFEKSHGREMTMDRDELELKSSDSVEAELRRRFDLKKAEDERKRLADEAEKAKAEAAAATVKLAESNKPPAPPTSSPATVRQSEPEESPFARAQRTQPATIGLSNGPDGPGVIEAPTEQQEWDAFEKAFMAALAPVKEARASLTHSKNIARAQVLANSILNAWNNR